MGAGIKPAASTTSAPTWTDIGISGTPDHDPNSAYVGLTVHGASEYTFSLDDTAQSRGTAGGAGWIVDLPADWDNDGTQAIMFRQEFIDSAPTPAGTVWVGMSICDNAGDMPTAGISLGTALYYGGAKQTQLLFRTTMNNNIANGLTTVETLILPPVGTPANGLGGMIQRIESGATSIGNSEVDSTAITSTIKFLVSAGYWTAGVLGTTTLRVKLQYAIVEMPT